MKKKERTIKTCYKCVFYDSDYGCICPYSVMWYACPIEYYAKQCIIVDFYINKSDNRYINKKLESVVTLNNVYLKLDENKETMTLELDYNSTILSANYCFIRELSHYYYIGEPTFKKQRIFLPIKTDLLMTFKNDILKHNAKDRRKCEQ